MSESPDLHRTKALELAIQAGGAHAEVVTRAKAYYEFLTSGKSTGKPAAPAAAQATVSETKPAAAATGKPATAPKATPAVGAKPAASSKPGAAAPKAAAAATPGAAPKGDTKDPQGNNTYDDVVAALQKVMRSVPGDNQKRDKGRALAYQILAAKGGGVKGARDLKPALYDAVVAGCETAIKPTAAAAPKAAPKAAAAPTVVEDDLGGEVDTSGASAETAGEDDPPEGGSGEGEDL